MSWRAGDDMIELLQGFPDDIVAIAYRGRVSGKDYETVLVPAVEAALTRHDKVRLYCEIPDGFEGFDAAAVWDDWKLGFGHLTRWGPVAAVTDVAWIRNTALALSPFVPTGVKVFHMAEKVQARAWLAA
jgi:hypothetical protein